MVVRAVRFVTKGRQLLYKLTKSKNCRRRCVNAGGFREKKVVVAEQGSRCIMSSLVSFLFCTARLSVSSRVLMRGREQGGFYAGLPSLPASYTRAMKSSTSMSILRSPRIFSTALLSPSMQLLSRTRRIAMATRGGILSLSMV